MPGLAYSSSLIFAFLDGATVLWAGKMRAGPTRGMRRMASKPPSPGAMYGVASRRVSQRNAGQPVGHEGNARQTASSQRPFRAPLLPAGWWQRIEHLTLSLESP
jgi:hypothetical protein